MADEDARVLAEEERIKNMGHKRQQDEFERKRREMLKKYEEKTGKESHFQLSTTEEKRSAPVMVDAPMPTNPTPAAKAHWEEEQRRKAHKDEEDAKRRHEAAAEVAAASGAGLASFHAEQDKKEREFQQRLAEEDKKKQEMIDAMKAASLAEHERQMKEEQERRQRQLAQQQEAEHSTGLRPLNIGKAEHVLKEANAGIYKHVITQWKKSLKVEGSDAGLEILDVKQVVSTPELLEEFEVRRSEVEAAGYGLDSASKKIQTANAWYSPRDETLAQILTSGFFNALSGARVSFYQDPVLAIKEGYSKMNVILLVRVVLAQHQELNGKYILANTKGCLPAFLVRYKVGS